MKIARVVAVSIAGALVAIFSGTGCTVGAGTGSVTGDLYVTDCWSGQFDLQPDFFAATPNPNDDSLFITVQRGSDYANFSDGISLLVSHVTEIRTGMLGQPLPVSLPPGVVPSGDPVVPDTNPADVQFSLYLQQTCRPETPGLYAMSSVTTDAPGSSDSGVLCSAQTAQTAAQCGPSTPAQVPTGTSTITFQHIFDATLAGDGDPGSLSASERLTQATFDVLLADPRDECPGGVGPGIGPPPPCRGHLTGSFQFYFERGKPAQAFP